MSSSRDASILLGSTVFTSQTLVRSYPGPMLNWRSIVQVRHEYFRKTTRQFRLSLKPIKDDVIYAVITTVVFRNGQTTTRSAYFRGDAEAVFQLATRLALRDYVRERTASCA